MKAVFVDCPAFVADLYAPELRAIVPQLEVEVTDALVEDMPARLEEAVGVILDHSYIDEAVLAACPKLEVIVFMGTGAASYVDLAAAERHGVTVRTIRGYGDRTVAEHAVALMFAAARQLAAMDRAIRGGDWQTLAGIELAGKVLGVVGTGGIGQEMVKLGDALNMKVLAWNRSGVAKGLPCTPCELDDLLARADIVSLHLALTDETTAWIDAKRIARLQPHAILVNTARGGLIDEAALVDALQGGRLGHAALDVFADEPLAADHPLRRLANVTLTGHAGFMTTEASARLLRMALEILRDELAALQTKA